MANAPDNRNEAIVNEVLAAFEDAGIRADGSIPLHELVRGQIAAASEGDKLAEFALEQLDRLEIDHESEELIDRLQECFDLISKYREDLSTFSTQAREIGEKLLAAGLVTDAVDGLAALDFVIVRHKELEAERDTLKNLVDEYDAKAAAAALAAQKKAKAVPVKRSVKARAIGPIKLKKDEKAPDAAEIMELISAAEEVVIVFSDGKSEITALPPQVIHGDAWYQQGNVIKLRLDSLKVYGPNRGEKPIVLDGYGLILDGELVAYSSRIDKLVLAPGSINELKDDIVFYG